MHLQATAREERLLSSAATATLETGVVAVCQGAGNKRLLEELGASIVVEGGQTMNPSAAELVAAIDAVPAETVLVLPNNANIVLAAEQAAGLSAKDVRVLPSDSVQAGFAAMVPFLATSPPDENERNMRQVLESVATGEVTVASRDAELDGVAIHEGAYLGLVDRTVVASSDELEAVTLAVVARLLEDERDWLGVLTGADIDGLDGIVDAIRERHPELDVEVNAGGQPHYPLLLVAE
jgi:dihydroxyacetone kinase-like predicted kinase